MQGDSGSSLTWDNNNNQNNPPFPVDTLYQNNILNPDMTGSKYQRYIFQASQSYFIPNTINNDLADFETGDLQAGSNKITILHGGTKTGSYKIKDSNPNNVKIKLIKVCFLRSYIINISKNKFFFKGENNEYFSGSVNNNNFFCLWP